MLMGKTLETFIQSEKGGKNHEREQWPLLTKYLPNEFNMEGQS